MKKVSRKCGNCKRVVFYLVNTGSILGLPLAKTETKRDWKYINKAQNYYCMDCVRELFPEEAR